MFLCFHPLVLSYILIMALTTRSMTYLRNHLILFSLPILLLCIVVIPHCRASNHGCLEEASPFVDNNKNTLISQGEVFELGFFTPDHDNSTSRYLGIWYYNQSNPKIIVWVANRDKPLLKRNGLLVIRDGIAKVLDAESKIYWSTGTAGLQEHPVRPPKPKQNNSMPNLVRLCLEDNGNLMLHKRGQGDKILWQSFYNPTDTFLPGMDAAGGSLNLTSWKAPNNPAKGSYVFTVQLDSGNQLLISRTGSAQYWESRITQFDPTPQPLLPLLLKNETQLKDYYNNTRLVMKFTGQLQFWRRDFERGYWSTIWSEPKDECGLYEACGRLGSCNSNNGWLCKCLPGTNASSPERWNVRDFSHGCSLKLDACRRNYLEDVFVRMPMMRVKAPKTNDTNVEDCETTCRTDCTCLAYSCGVTDCSSNEKTCLTWSSYDLTDLQEEYPKGVTIFVRTNRSDIEKTSRDCKPCGTYIIPYPLSTAANCGDSAYFNFRCNATTGQVYFSPSNLTYKVTLIDPDAKRFTIQVGLGKSCDSKYTDLVALLRKDSLQYDLQKCKAVKDQSSLEGERYFTEVDIAWKPPPEPTCSGSSGCRDWRHTSCKSGVGGKMRCRCGSRYHWDSENLRCTEVVSLKVVLPCVAGALAIVLLCGIFYTYYTWKRRLETQRRSAEFKGNVTEGIDVPFYDWEILLAATNNFADVNKLGMGGFGSVYRGKLPDGQEIAVKRLSKVSVQGLEEFRTEVELIAKLQHRNLVRLLGYCTTADERILVYEYLPNGSLDSCLFDEKHSVKLDWEKRFNIILSIARGLLYLHQDSRLRIIHRDLKPSNILLDEELNPKISDFGIARIVGGKETEATTGRVVGTYGYMSPEYAYEGTFSIKSDVFSFGVVILETISGRRNSRIFMLEHGLSLLGYAWKLWNEDKGLELMDPKLTETCFPSEVLKCIHIGLLCVQEDPSDRPTMSTVVYMLSGEDASLPLAKQPAFMNRKPLLEDNASSSSAKDSSVHEAMTVSTVGR